MNQHQYDPRYVTEWHEVFPSGEIRRFQIRAAHGGYFRTESGDFPYDAACLPWPKLTPDLLHDDPFRHEKHMGIHGRTQVPLVVQPVCEISVAAIKEAIEIRDALRDTGYSCREVDYQRSVQITTLAARDVTANDEDISALLMLMPLIDPARIRPLFEHKAS